MDAVDKLLNDSSTLTREYRDSRQSIIEKLVDETVKQIRKKFIATGLSSQEFNKWLHRKWLSDIIGYDAWRNLNRISVRIEGTAHFAAELSDRLSITLPGSNVMHVDVWTHDSGVAMAREFRFRFYQYVSPD